MREIIVFMGCVGSGKTFNADKLVAERGFKKISFADSLREIAFTTLDINPKEINYRDFKSEAIYRAVTFRNFLQKLGDGVRKFDEDYFTKATIQKIKDADGNICIDDLRFGNEFRLLNDFCSANNIILIPYFCNYPSEYLVTDSPHKSEKMAQYFRDKGYQHLQEVDKNAILCYYYTVEKPNKLKNGVTDALTRIKKAIDNENN